MRPIDAIEARADIIEVTKALGYSVRGNRIRAVWRNGKGLTVSLNRTKGVFCDHKTGKGGNVFQLVMLILGCGFPDSLKWLADFYGIELRHPSRQEVRTAQARRTRAQNAAVELAGWRWNLTQDLRGLRNTIWSGCRRVDRWAAQQQQFSDDLRWSAVAEVPDRLRLADDIDSYVGHIQQLSAAGLIGLRERLGGDGLVTA